MGEAGGQPRQPTDAHRSLFARWAALRKGTQSTIIAVALTAAVLVAAGVSAFTQSDDGDGDSDLIPEHRQMVDTLALDRDCAGLQEAFDNADENRGTPGSERAIRNVALMRYADDTMQRIGCYGD